ncbi:MAG: SDR family oxidoreductase [Myxococcota bacterium]|nr:SDR family oxidoreductase [Myxococcota bacterium]
MAGESSRLAGKVAIITGAARGQGAAEAKLFVEHGAKVVLGDVLDEGRAVADGLGDAATFVPMDIRREEDWAAAVEAAEALGPLNVLINNAAVVHFSSIVETTLEDYKRVIDINQVGTFLGIRSVIEPMKAAGGGSIINVSSIDGLQAKNALIAYAASKWAIRGMTKVAALELGHHGIRVNSLHPGGIDTVMGNPAGLENIDEFYKRHPIPRAGRPEEMAQLALFLASDESSYSTGSEFVADGGWMAGQFSKALPTS